MNRFQEAAPAINDQAQLALTQEAANRLLRLAPRVVQAARHYFYFVRTHGTIRLVVVYDRLN